MHGEQLPVAKKALSLHRFLQKKNPFAGISGVEVDSQNRLVVAHGEAGFLSQNPPTQYQGAPVVYKLCSQQIGATTRLIETGDILIGVMGSP
ncbi:MAG: hypothetical protein E6Q40_00845 [Cupriavidus sp.]|nr:MAG: hypothetical protein E6Q40_00845 [Cupriavidus sp.]